jgi:hypothetical protein
MKVDGTFRKAGLLAAALCGFLIVGGAAPAQARPRDERCELRIHRAEEKLEQAIHRHGPNSRQAQKRRHQLDEAREHCHR